MPNKGTDQAVTRREHNQEAEAKRVIGVDPFGGQVTEGNFTTAIDEVSSSVAYIGIAQIGTATSVAEWQISKVATTGTVTFTQWANATDAFTNTFDDRLTYTYS